MKMLTNGRSTPTGCSCCNTKRERRAAKHTSKRDEERRWRKEEDR